MLLPHGKLQDKKIFQNVSIIIGWILLHYAYWDPKKTNSTNKVRLLRQIDFFTNPDTAMENIMITWVNVCLIFWSQNFSIDPKPLLTPLTGPNADCVLDSSHPVLDRATFSGRWRSSRRSIWRRLADQSFGFDRRRPGQRFNGSGFVSKLCTHTYPDCRSSGMKHILFCFLRWMILFLSSTAHY